MNERNAHPNEPEEEEVFGYASHDLIAERYALGRIIADFPWATFFEARGFTHPYPYLIYESPEAETLFEAMTDHLSQLILLTDIVLSLRLTYEQSPAPKGNPLPEAHLSLEWTDPSDWGEQLPEGVSYAEILPLIADAVACHLKEEEGYGVALTICRDKMRTKRLSSGVIMRANYRFIPQ